jgi:hypothetical protein
MGLSEDPRDGRARAEPGKAIRIPQAARSSWRWHAPIMTDSLAASTAFPAASRAGFRTLSPSFSPTHFHEDPELNRRHSHLGIVLASIVLVCGLVWLTLAPAISRRLGTAGLRVIDRVVGLLLAAAAIELMATGLRTLFPGLA